MIYCYAVWVYMCAWLKHFVMYTVCLSRIKPNHEQIVQRKHRVVFIFLHNTYYFLKVLPNAQQTVKYVKTYTYWRKKIHTIKILQLLDILSLVYHGSTKDLIQYKDHNIQSFLHMHNKQKQTIYILSKHNTLCEYTWLLVTGRRRKPPGPWKMPYTRYVP